MNLGTVANSSSAIVPRGVHAKIEWKPTMDNVDAAISKISSQYKVEPNDPMFAVLKAVAEVVRSPGERELVNAQMRTQELAGTLSEATAKLSTAIDSLGQQVSAIEIFRFRRTAAYILSGLSIGIVLTSIACALLYRWTTVFALRDQGIGILHSHPMPNKTMVRITGKTLKSAKREGDSILMEFSK